MIDHVLGRPSVTFRKYQVFAVVLVWGTYLVKGNRHGPPVGRKISTLLSNRLTAWQTLVMTLLWLYVARNFGKLIGLECPEPLANLYTPSFFRATWVTTALDAGFWSAMHIKRKWIRDYCSILFTGYYLLCAEQADEKVRKVRSVLTVDHLRVAWNVSLSPYINFAARLTRPRFMRYAPREIRIPRPAGSSYSEPVRGWLYFNGPVSALKKHTKVILNIPGGGFVAMSPRTHDDSLFAWAGKTGRPILSLDYRKAPEFPYPYALNECYDVYKTIVATRGRCVGLSGDTVPQIIVSGDSAGGNLAAGVTLMVLQSGSTDTRKWHGEEPLPVPEGLVLIYPALDVNIGNWMTDEQMALIRDRGMRKTNKRVLRRKNSDYRHLSPNTPLPSDEEDEDDDSPDSSSPQTKGAIRKPNPNDKISRKTSATASTPAEAHNPTPTVLKTRLATPSLISYVNDRVLTPEMMRAMIILYIGPHSRPDFSTDYLLSPVLAPEQLLARFPKTFFLTGERDPLVDDTVIMAGRIRAAKRAAWAEREELDVLTREERRRGWREADHVHVTLVEGISHGFIQFGALFHEAWGYIFTVGGWYEELFAAADVRARNHALGLSRSQNGHARGRSGHGTRHHRRTGTNSSADDDHPLEMSSLAGRSKAPLRLDLGDGTSLADAADSVPPTPYTPYEPMTPGSEFAKDHPMGRAKSMVSLASEDDLLGRRMKGLVGGLTRARDVEGPD